MCVLPHTLHTLHTTLPSLLLLSDARYETPPASHYFT